MSWVWFSPRDLYGKDTAAVTNDEVDFTLVPPIADVSETTPQGRQGGARQCLVAICTSWSCCDASEPGVNGVHLAVSTRTLLRRPREVRNGKKQRGGIACLQISLRRFLCDTCGGRDSPQADSCPRGIQGHWDHLQDGLAGAGAHALTDVAHDNAVQKCRERCAEYDRHDAYLSRALDTWVVWSLSRAALSIKQPRGHSL